MEMSWGIVHVDRLRADCWHCFALGIRSKLSGHVLCCCPLGGLVWLVVGTAE
ncbi:hypothetical protein VFPPC_16405 [Pochonia chlamydosporia 170]|uniref:Uncharacterized protein n=1 Tax=Pochonia chlamydosporia 170 TaxID=1380566 RepID=A0A179FC65_METCM|nr:hypothetical protein VFPPC_16405 [Pochonia chlamydosporia 170]OAQ62957.1 hypothetical protein VFPPC_16405 [Pochonia chlamydosporia 170]